MASSAGMADGDLLTDAAFDEWLERRFPDPLPLPDRVAAGRTRVRRQRWALVVVVPSVLAGVVWAAFAVDAAFPMDPRPSAPPGWANSVGGVMLILGIVSAVMGLLGLRGFREQLEASRRWTPRAVFALTSSQWSELSEEMAGRRPLVPGDEVILDLWAQRVTMSTMGAWVAVAGCVVLSSPSVFEWRPTPLQWVLLVVPAGFAFTSWRRQWIARSYLRRRRVAVVADTG